MIERMPNAYSLDVSVVASPNQLSTTFGTDVVILGLRDSVYYGLSDVGAHVWQLLQTRRRLGDLVQCVVAEFDVSTERATTDLQALLAELEGHGLAVVDDPAHP